MFYNCLIVLILKVVQHFFKSTEVLKDEIIFGKYLLTFDLTTCNDPSIWKNLYDAAANAL